MVLGGGKKMGGAASEIGAPASRISVLANRPDAPGQGSRTRYLDRRSPPMVTLQHHIASVKPEGSIVAAAG
jgi:hypothetical protein